MERTLTNIQIANITQVLNDLSAKDKDIKSIRVKYRIGKLLTLFSKHFEDFQKARNEIIEECAEKDEDGEYKKAKDEDGKEDPDRIMLKDTDLFNEKMTELSEDEVTVNLPTTLNVDDLEDSGLEIEMIKLMALEPILTGGDDE